ncbi:MAG TPA: radical SAM protein [Chthonomonadaceae bacterium]|nr:radical SAM protein [Chthonomonadaceae bacterium]
MKTPDGTWTEATEGLCPTCLRTVPATLFERDGQIWMERDCPRHGTSRALLASDAAEYLRFRQYVPERMGGCCCGPESACETGPPTCVLLLEITLACNLRCPTCYADAHGHDFMSLEEARRRLDAFFRTQSTLDVLMLSGGEPTIHPQFADILALALAYPIGRILVNTNGLRIQQSDALLATLAAHRDRVELFFSFSSFRPEVHARLYGKDLREVKLSALRRAQEAGLFVTLVPTLERGVNDDEIGDLYRFALSLDNINGLNFQPVMSAGRYEHGYDGAGRLTLTDVLHELECQTGGALRSSDFVGLPCSHPDCCVLTYGFLDTPRKVITPLPRHLDIARYMELFSDRISFSGLLQSATRRVWSDVSNLRGRQTLRDLALLFRQAGIRDILPLIGKPDLLGKRVFRIVVKPFMDAHTYDCKRIEQCCTKLLNEQGEAVSFCEYNVFHRGRKLPARENLIPLVLRP